MVSLFVGLTCAVLAPASVRQQPIPFSHRQHCAQVACSVCHATAATGERAGMPSTSECMLCHNNLKKDSSPIRKLVEYDKEKKPVPWVRVYLLPDFVFFSHAKHAAAKVECAACHGPVAQRSVLAEIHVKMKTCIDCHRMRGASIECNLCHELAQ
ncbi:MAG TPA: cytochrome c3 family protein [Bryobacterales bacterium]|nr:cytochrome c3 family protein [Bryobacterales bacterium]